MPDLPKSSGEYASSEQELPESVKTPHTICVPVPASFENANQKPDGIFIANEAKELLSESSFDDSSETKGKTDFIPEGSLLGRYRIGSILGQGGFGSVYLAEDEELNRTVAIKVLHSDRLASREEGKARYLKEARLLAGLDHPHIVPIYDVGDIDKGTPYIVSKFIPGCTLGERIRRSRLSIVESAELIARMAEALAYAHDHQVVHRDIKPGNIALENGEKPYLIDFGLAERESNMAHVSGLSGTPSYMSPEQANGENHLVDGRSDIYSLGVVFYELLLGELPHEGEGVIQLLLNISKLPPRPPREIDRSVPAELERIVLKCLAKKASDRYTTAGELADDLRHWLAPDPNEQTKSFSGAKIIPKGLRSFDTSDSDFYLSLLPGPQDRNGLPEGIRFWKSRLEESDPSKTFRVGVIYGPSGCGKSSFVKAGLLPRLATRLRVVYAEATADETEGRLLRGLERACPDLPKYSRLRDAINHLRRVGDSRRKVVLVIDQFEQWLHGDRNEENSELECALRQCDGERVQCVVMVRDDFWLALNRFMRSLEIKLVEGQNAALIDLFDLSHARRVLSAFGRAYGALPTDTPLSSDQEQFLKQSVSGLAQDEKVISVRLSLFAEMMKGRPWTPATLSEVGGADGIGVTFLEETFGSRSAPPEHRRQQERARSVLKALLPGSGTDIKGHMRSQDELQAAAGLIDRPKDFEELLAIIDGELRLITPTDAEGIENADSSNRYYQLTHDFLVPSLREWVTRKQKETPQGRAELLLEDRADVWNSRPENRQLPSLIQWLKIRRWTKSRTWTPAQRKMMARANVHHAARSLTAGVFVALAALSLLMVRNQNVEQRNKTYAEGLVRAVIKAETPQIPHFVEEMADYRRWADPLLREINLKADLSSPEKLRTSLALLPSDSGQVEFLYGRLLEAEPRDVDVIRDALAPHKAELLEKLWTVAAKVEKPNGQQRLRAAAALATYDPENANWSKAGWLVVKDLVRENPLFMGQWSEAFRPVKNKLIAGLSDVYRDLRPEATAERSLATNILADYSANDPSVLSDLLLDADEKQFAAMFPKLKLQAENVLPLLEAEVEKLLPSMLPLSEPKRDTLAKRQANAAVAMLRLNRPEKVWPLLRHSPDPRVRSYLIHRMSPLGADAKAILNRLSDETDVTIQRALLLGLGEYKDTDFSMDERKVLLPKVREIFKSASDPGLHASSDWLLRSWGEDAWLSDENDQWAKDKDGRVKRISKITEMIKAGVDNTQNSKAKTALNGEENIRQNFVKMNSTPPQWFVNTQGQTMVVLPGPVEFLMGSPQTEAQRKGDEAQHRRRINRSFAIASKSVTLAELRRSFEDFENGLADEFSHSPDLPAVYVNWYAALKYCNWLSREEGLELCYEFKAPATVIFKKDYLSLSGYRLPTEPEMEYAIRAGAATSRYFGESDELLDHYSWFLKNSGERLQRVGLKKPNDFGLFDAFGNCFTWCLNHPAEYPRTKEGEVAEDKEVNVLRVSGGNGVLRGGGYVNPESFARSARRVFIVMGSGARDIGIRPVRTINP